MPLTLTEKAIEKLENELVRKRNKPTELFRLMATSSGGFGIQLDDPTPGDIVLPEEGRPLVAVAPHLSDRVTDATLDVGRAADEPEWVLVRRKAGS
jgi:hypothetical protein